MRKMYVNGKEIKGNMFVYDGCHKIYIIEDYEDLRNCQECWGELVNGRDLFDISLLKDCYENSCDLRFISNWKLDIQYVRQFENAEFRYE
jgi:hypothetical protein